MILKRLGTDWVYPHQRNRIEGAGMWLGAFGCARGVIVFVVAGVFGYKRDGGRARDGGICAVREDGRIHEGGLANIDDWVIYEAKFPGYQRHWKDTSA